MRLRWIIALAAILAPASAMAQDAPRKVMFAAPGVAILVPETVTGPPNRREMEIMLVFPRMIDGGDVHLNPWIYDCTTMQAQALDGRAFIGTEFVRGTAIAAPMAATEPGKFERVMVGYACSGERRSTDDRTLRTFSEAVDYGRKLSAEVSPAR